MKKNISRDDKSKQLAEALKENIEKSHGNTLVISKQAPAAS